MEGDPVPPSSPPHATTVRAPDSPFFEPRYSAFSPKSSSPPPVFSSDDSRESVDLANYESPRIFKNKRKGAWWDTSESAHNTPQPKKTRITRNYDSGVYMMSDSNESSESLLLPPKTPFGLDGAGDVMPEDDKNDGENQHDGEDEKESAEAESFNHILNERLEMNSDTYTFEELELEDKHIRQIGKLKSVIKNVPDPGNDLPVEGQYRNFVPEIYINLSGNLLRRLTPSLFDVQNITTLVLADNHIQELPAQISRLCNLQELNIAKNELRWLPFDFVKLMQENTSGNLDIMSHNGNPWLMPRGTRMGMLASLAALFNQLMRVLKDYATPLDLGSLPEMKQLHDQFASHPGNEQWVWYLGVCDLEARLLNDLDPTVTPPKPIEGIFPHHPVFTRTGNYETREPLYIARTPVSYFDQTGRIENGSPKPPSSNDDDFDSITSTARGAHGVPSSWYTPPNTNSSTSLATTAFKVALDLGHDLGKKKDLPAWFDEYDALIPFAEQMLEQADSNNCGGYGKFKKCHVCEREYIVARAEWIEWWYVLAAGILPFKVQVCSWRCVPDTIMQRPTSEFFWE